MDEARAQFTQILLGDPLSEEARKERRNLLGLSAVGIAIAKIGLLPTKIAALGIEFNAASRPLLMKAFAGVVAYFLAAFIIYSSADFVCWGSAYWKASVDRMVEEMARPEEPPQHYYPDLPWLLERFRTRIVISVCFVFACNL